MASMAADLISYSKFITSMFKLLIINLKKSRYLSCFQAQFSLRQKSGSSPWFFILAPWEVYKLVQQQRRCGSEISIIKSLIERDAVPFDLREVNKRGLGISNCKSYIKDLY